MPPVPLLAVALLWPALLPWLVATALPLVLAWWAVCHAKRVGWAAIDLVERAARAARITRSGLPLPLTLVRMLLVTAATLAATRPFLGDGSPPRGERLVVGDPTRRIELVTAGPLTDGAVVALRAALEALARGRPESFPTVERVAVSEAGRAGDASRLIVLTDGAVPTGDEAARLANAVRDGAALVVCLGPESVVAPLLPPMSAWLEDLVGVSVAGSVSLEDEAIVALEAAAAEPSRGAVELAGPRVNRVAELVLKRDSRTAATVLARSSTTSRPLLVEGAVGRGRVVVSALPLTLPQAGGGQAPWSDLATWPAFVPLVDRLVTSLLEPTSETPGSALRFVGRLAGVPLARPLLACGLVLAAIETMLSWWRARAAGLAFDAASVGGRCVVFALLSGMFALWGGRPPAWPGQPPAALPVAVVIDVSPSMGGESGQSAARLEQLIEAAVGGDAGRSAFDRLARDRPVVIHSVAESLQRLGRYPADVAAANLRMLAASPPAADASRLGDAVLTLLDEQYERDDKLAAVIVMSDGAITGGASWAAVAQRATRRGVPLVAVPVGDDAKASAGLPVGFRFAAAPAPAIAQPGETITIPVRGVASTSSSRPVPLHGDGSSAGLAADQPPTAAGYDYTCGASFSLRMPAGGETNPAPPPNELPAASTRTLTLTAGDGADRHTATVPVVVADDPLRVLLVDHAPRYEFRFLERLLTNDRRYAVSTRLLAAKDVEGLRANATLPQSVAAWSDFDVVVLGDLPIATAAEHAATWASLSEAVSREGVGIAWLPGPRWAEADAGITSWLPAVPGIARSGLAGSTVPRRLRLLTAGRTTGWLAADRAGAAEASFSLPTFSSLPPLSIRPTGRVIAITETAVAADPQPAIVVSQAGLGMIVGHFCDTWRWQSGASSRGSTSHARHWLHLLPRLAERRRLARLVAATLAVRPLDPLVGKTIRVDLMPTRPMTDLAGWILEVESSAGPPRRLGIAGGTPGAVATLQLEELAAGRHRLRLIPPADAADWPATTIVHEIVVNEPLVEQAAGPAGTGPLRAAFAAGGGAVVPLDRIETLPDTIAKAIGSEQRGDRSSHWLTSQTAAHLLLATLVAACTAAWWPRPNSAPAERSRS